MTFAVPGRADDSPPSVVDRWNDRITAEYERLEAGLGSRFFALDPADVSADPPVAVTWFGDPAEPAFCLGASVARELSDWGVRGRHELHNEYCEYAVVVRTDPAGNRRIKRVTLTTELREYWVTVAGAEPELLRDMVEATTGRSRTFTELYGVANLSTLSVRTREIAFARLVAGHGNSREFQDAGVPAQPTGPVNREDALFMTHPINGLDDLLYIVMFGARPYMIRRGGALEPATREEIFRSQGVEHLACRHADPAAAMAAHGAAVQGRAVAFADPLGMYFQSFAREVFLLDGAPIPTDWVHFGRGEQGMAQRLEIGPSDDAPEFLDQARVAVGAGDEPLTGGHQIAQNVEVGPLLVVGPTSDLTDQDVVELPADDREIVCRDAGVCSSISVLKQEFDAAPPGRLGPRLMGPRP